MSLYIPNDTRRHLGAPCQRYISAHLTNARPPLSTFMTTPITFQKNGRWREILKILPMSPHGAAPVVEPKRESKRKEDKLWILCPGHKPGRGQRDINVPSKPKRKRAASGGRPSLADPQRCFCSAETLQLNLALFLSEEKWENTGCNVSVMCGKSRFCSNCPPPPALKGLFLAPSLPLLLLPTPDSVMRLHGNALLSQNRPARSPPLLIGAAGMDRQNRKA